MLPDLGDAIADLAQKPVISALSTVGVTIGVAALIAMLSISEGARSTALEQIASLGMSTIRIEDATARTLAESRDRVNLSRGLNERDVDQLSAWLSDNGTVASFRRHDEMPVRHQSNESVTTVLEVSSDWFEVEGASVATGRKLVRIDDQRAGVCVLGSILSRDLAAVPGDRVRTGGEICRVVGVLERQGSLMTEGTGLSAIDFDQLVVVPMGFVQDAEPSRVDGVIVNLATRDLDRIVDASEQLRHLIAEQHGGVTDFLVVTPRKLMLEAERTQSMFRLVMGSIASLTLVVGGIGMMNMMLANVSERIREIALRRALGASQANIIRFYLMHAFVMAVIGGFAGIVLGVVVALVVQQAAGWPVVFSTFAIVSGPLCALFVGLVFGYFPARLASRLDIADAVRQK